MTKCDININLSRVLTMMAIIAMLFFVKIGLSEELKVEMKVFLKEELDIVLKRIKK